MLTVVAVVVSSAGMFNTFIDPLGVFGSPRIAGINEIKPYLDHHRELTRYQGARRHCPNTGIFGNSRAEIGFDPESSALAAHGLAAYNHAIPGTTASTTYRQILWLQAENCLPRTIFLGVDFFDFLGGAVPSPRPAPQLTPAPQLDIRFFAESVFSISGLRDSLATLLLQQSRYPATSTDLGFNPLFNYIPEIRQSGHYLLFRQRAEENVRNWTRKPLRIRPQDGGISDAEAMVDAVLASATKAGITTYVIIYPYHAQIRLMLERLGMGDLFTDWKRIVVAAAERNAERGGKIEVWDFSGISSETLEAIPVKGDHQTHLSFYWEAGHFKKKLGDLAIARMLGKTSEFGIKLDSANLDDWLLEDRHRVQVALSASSALVYEIDDVLAHRLRR